jgi:transcription elongation factor Elf1
MLICPKCESDDINILKKQKVRMWIACYNCGKGSYIRLLGANKPTRKINKFSQRNKD